MRLQWLRKLFLEKERRLQAFYNSAPSDKTGENVPLLSANITSPTTYHRTDR